MELTAGRKRTKWRHATPIYNFVCERFHRLVSLLQKARRACHGAMFRRRSRGDDRCGIELIAVIVKHMAGNMRSRWMDFLTSDGEKPDRNRDAEFEDAPRTRAERVALRGKGSKDGFDALAPRTAAVPTSQGTVRSGPRSVRQAMR